MQGLEVPIKDVCSCPNLEDAKLMSVDLYWKNTIRNKKKSTITFSDKRYVVASYCWGGVLPTSTTTNYHPRCGAYAERQANGRFSGSSCHQT
jgi:hypothetical protein